jgi:hypothetical protein
MGACGLLTGEKIGIIVVAVVVVFFTFDFSLITLLREGEGLAKIYLGGFLTSFFLLNLAYFYCGTSFLATLLMLCLALISLLILRASTLMGISSEGGFSKKEVSSSSLNF